MVQNFGGFGWHSARMEQVISPRDGWCTGAKSWCGTSEGEPQAQSRGLDHGQAALPHGTRREAEMSHQLEVTWGSVPTRDAEGHCR